MHRTGKLCSMMLLFFVAAGCQREAPVRYGFPKLDPSEIGVQFENRLAESDDFNIIEYLYFYNGGGVAIGDINNDSLPDIYFTANQGKNALYLNKGNFRFEDITDRSGTEGTGNWKTGVTMADVDGDNDLDIFICGVGKYKSFDGRNQLFINNGDLTFTEKAEAFGLAFQGLSTHASFFDYDNDGDLDLYLLNHSVHTVRSYGAVALRLQSDPLSGDKLYRNVLAETGITRFEEVTSSAGIHNSQIGYGLGVGVSDLNLDGHIDLYVSNDFHENDYLYLNNGDGSFRQVLEKATGHVSRFSMGNDIADINNDGWPDIVTLDMLPADESVIKTTAGEDPYDIYHFKQKFGYHHQVSRNALQLSAGVTTDGIPQFSDFALLAGVAATDWSWGPLLADFDNDGYKDLFITNGIARRPNDLDYINFISSDTAKFHAADQEFVDKMPSGSVPNQIFRNNGDLTFTNKTGAWLPKDADLSNGVSYGDLDNDGDLDLVVNNLNGKAAIYRNDLSNGGKANAVRFRLHGSGANTAGIGAKIFVYTSGRTLYMEQVPSRGWQSSVENIVHCGIGESTRIDSATIVWPDRTFQTILNVPIGKVVNVSQRNARGKWSYADSEVSDNVSEASSLGFDFRHTENEYVSFNREKTIPHMLTTRGPEMALGDINNDGLEDVFIGAAAGKQSCIYLQMKSGKFKRSLQPEIEADSLAEDVGAALVDVNGDNSLDLVVVGGGQQFDDKSAQLQPRLYLNDRKGKFKRDRKAFPELFVDASCVRVIDIGNDNIADLFIGGGVRPGSYGQPVDSYLLRNNGRGQFSIVEQSWPLKMVSDAVVFDVDNDSLEDLVLVGEWSAASILLQRRNGTFARATSGLDSAAGWWNTVHAADMDADGDDDLLLGNLGLNSRLRASSSAPVRFYLSDIDKNGSVDPILTYYNQGESYPFTSRDQLVKQVPPLKKKFLQYESFRNIRLEDIVSLQSNDLSVDSATLFSSVYAENLGGGRFSLRELPLEAQVFPIQSFLADDLNDDGFMDFMAVGNLYAVQPDFGRYDAGKGIVMLGDGQGNFKSLPLSKSGFLIPGEGRDIKSLVSSDGKKFYIIARNNDTPLIYRFKP